MKNMGIFRKEIINPFYSATFRPREEEVIDRIHEEFRSKKFPLNVVWNPSSGISKSRTAFCVVNAIKTHKKRVHFQCNSQMCSCETSDISFIVDYKYRHSNSGKAELVSRAISFTQLKMGKNSPWFTWKLAKNQLYLMKYWPPFTYRGVTFDLKEFRNYPDLGSFYMFIYKNLREIEPLLQRFPCCVVPISDLEIFMNKVFTPSTNGNDYDKIRDIFLKLSPKVDLEIFLVRVLLQNVGLSSDKAVEFIDKLYPGFLSTDPPNEEKDEAEGYSVAVRISVVIGGEYQE
ncbi:MAG: hypothetical protein LM573_03690 [Thermofilum sp.]|nr:hypothetical protein [Thermofilum sp.]